MIVFLIFLNLFARNKEQLMFRIMQLMHLSFK